MSYTVAEREEIARQLEIFSKEPYVETYITHGNVITRRTEPMTEYHREMLSLVAADVLGQIQHAE